VTTSLSSQRIPELDGLRGIAIALILIWHYFVVSALVRLDALPTAGIVLVGSLVLTWSGVDLFFVLSGFLIGGILIDHQAARYYFKAFYIRRITRIFPLYFLWILLFVVLGSFLYLLLPWELVKHLFETSLPLWAYITFTQNFIMAQLNGFGAEWLGITWSLAIEEQFYLFLPLLIRFVSLRKLPYLLIVLIIAAPVVRLILFIQQTGFASVVLMPDRMDALLIGVLCNYGMRQERFVNYCRTHLSHFYMALFVLAAGIVVLLFLSPASLSVGMLSIGYTWLALFYGCLLLIAINEKAGIVTRIVRNPLLQKLGIVAYGVYLFHQAVNGLSHAVLAQQTPMIRNVQDGVITLVALAVTIGMASLSWKFFEKPIVAIGRLVNYE
jgi:peptidoglycan/LPS O-acetylase OafA/YrhL